MRIGTNLITLLLFGTLLNGCAPIFSELQSARTVGKGNIELTPHFSSTDFYEQLAPNGVQNHLGLQVANGLSDRLDLRTRYEFVWPKGFDLSSGTNVVSLGLKYGLAPDRVAIYLPVGRALGEGSSQSWEIQPTLLFTQPIIPRELELTFAPKYVAVLCESCADLYAINLGLSVGSDVRRWSIRPEYGLAFQEGDPDFFGQFSLGFSWNLTATKK